MPSRSRAPLILTIVCVVGTTGVFICVQRGILPFGLRRKTPRFDVKRTENYIIVSSMPEIRHSVCALDCPDACALLVTVENGQGTKLRGDPSHPVTRGFLCGKVAQYLEREYSPGRLLYPQKRIGAKGEGRFERITWDEAIDTIAQKLTAISREHG